MNRFATRYWLQDWPLSVQLWACLSLAEGLTLAAILLYVLLLLRPEEPGQWYGLAALFPLLLIANLFAAKLAARRITEPLERLAGNLERIKGKNWSEPVLQVARRDEIGTLVNTLSQIQRNVVELNEDEEFFYQSVSHGLKTPIMVIQNCCAAYQDGIYGSEAIDIIMKESLAVEAGIRKLLYVSSFDHMLGKQSDFRPVELRGLMEEHKAAHVEEPLTVTGQAVGQVLSACGVEAPQVEAFERQCDAAYGAGADLSPRNLVDPKQLELRTPDVTIRVSPDRGDLVETRIINGARYILIRAEEGVEVNGVQVRIRDEQ